MNVEVSRKTLQKFAVCSLVLILTGAGVAWAQNTSQNNPHGELPTGLSCENCHTSTGWVPVKEPMDFNHNTQTSFQLLGSHIEVACQSCHTTLKFSEPELIVGDQCATCHEDVHSGMMSESCETCHNENSFHDVEGLLIHSRTAFQLTGAHQTIDCQSCHTPDMGLVFSPPPASQDDCYSCHATDYEEAHAGSGFPTECADCHNTSTWEDAEFDHSAISGGFELLGAHASANCQSCHTPDMGLVFSPPPASQDDCYSCHATDYEEAHAGSGFPTECADCHNTSTWEDADFLDHDNLYFPIYSGNHQGEWGDNCQTCHTVPSDFSVFSCITCHEHNQTEMNREHDDVTGYIYNSDACYSCHPNGSEDDADDDD